jgi:uncharacterized iron-regulated membrane protein
MVTNRVYLRQAVFQVHLWAGLLACLYLVVVGVSGALLVFQEELSEIADPQLMRATEPAESLSGESLERVGMMVAAAYPQWTVNTVYAPLVRGENYAVLVSRGGQYRYVFASAHDGRLLGARALDEGWVNWLADLHFRLLAGSVGFTVNGIGAACLFLLCVTGAIIWWPGIQKWKRALSVDWHRGWKRVNFDLHSAVGFWILPMVAIWAISGVYFVWPAQFVAAVSSLSKAPHATPPVFHAEAGLKMPLSLLVARALTTQGNVQIQGVIYASGTQPLTVMVTRDAVNQFANTTYVYVDPVKGAVLGSWQPGARETLGDWIIWLMAPLHFGTAWGTPVKALWAVLGLSIPLLSVTGVLMYWNRYLGKRWRRLRQAVLMIKDAHAA